MTKFEYNKEIHNVKNPDIIVPEIMKRLNPNSVIDFGCGIGSFLNSFKRHGVEEIFGIDGDWVDKSQLYSYINPDEFKAHDLEAEIIINKPFDLVISLEVAEHLSEKSSKVFVQNLTQFNSPILFSAAIPNQGGYNHLNEQWLTYWEELFNEVDFVFHDVIRPIFWDNEDLFWWYKQNMVLVTPRNYQINFIDPEVPMRKIVHYELYNKKVAEIEKIASGKFPAKFYIKGLIASIFGYQVANFIKKQYSIFLKKSQSTN